MCRMITDMGHQFLLLLLLVVCGRRRALGTDWLSMATLPSPGAVPNRQACETVLGLFEAQVQMCKRNLQSMDSVRHGAEIALKECEEQFRNRRWNCSVLAGLKSFGIGVPPGTREAAFVHAIASAGLTFAVTRACSRGDLPKCGCDRKVQGDSEEGFKWSGCSDNIRYGMTFSQEFLDSVERERGTFGGYSLMNRHNNEAGRKAVSSQMRVECKCHGVSGSCEVKTCWKVMPPFGRLGLLLKDLFDGATEVKRLQVAGRPVLVPKEPGVKPHTVEELVYLLPSPDYCSSLPDLGVLGTERRLCDRTSRGQGGCRLLCCGRGYRTQARELTDYCSCTFRWCCAVRCQPCRRRVKEHSCR